MENNNLDNLDFITELYKTNKDNIELSKEYLLCRKEYSKYYNLLITNLCKAKLEKSSKALENKFLELLNDSQYGEESKKYYEAMIVNQQTYKGLEKCIEAYKNHSIGLMAIVKDMQQGELIENVKAKYSRDE